jgi:hypothetical protein
MVVESSFGKACDWALASWLFNTGMYTLSFVNKENLCMMLEMGLI